MYKTRQQTQTHMRGYCPSNTLKNNRVTKNVFYEWLKTLLKPIQLNILPMVTGAFLLPQLGKLDYNRHANGCILFNH